MGCTALYLAAERWLTARFGGHAVWNRWLVRLALALLTYFLINITWVFFRAQDFATAWRLIDTMLTLNFEGKKVLWNIEILTVSIVTLAMLATHWFMRNRRLDEVVGTAPRWLIGCTWGIMLWAIVTTQGGSDAFIYFQF